jgi:S-adenosylmethionine-diacylglycerol 3-amino-3-carboxypropyl transferase
MASQPNRKITAAVVRDDVETKQRLLDRAFAMAFKGLVYAQIWEDPVVDMAALQIEPGQRIATIASGGCNVFSYLVADPAEIVAVDLNTAHVALGHLKRTAIERLPDYDALRQFFADADSKANVANYRQHVRPHLDDVSVRYWEGRDLIGRRRINGFAAGLYRRGLLGNFIGLAHLVARLHRVDPRQFLAAQTVEEQRAIFDAKFAPFFDRKFIRWITDQRSSLFGLGIPPAQYDVLSGGRPMAEVLRERLEKLACDFPLTDNYFAWQAFGRGYGKGADMPLPPYLQADNYAAVRARAARVTMLHANMTDMLAASDAASFDRYVFLDAQDWMTDAQLDALWTQVDRTARPGARVLFRTAAEPTLLPGRLDQQLLDRWDYRAEESLAFTAADRSAIYGGVHLYVRRAL